MTDARPKHPSRPGILGGGQLGRMLIQAGIDYNLNFRVLDRDPAAPCALPAAEFVAGDPTDYETVMNFGRGCDALTIEIENVNADALEDLRKEGLFVFPSPAALRIFQDKIVQKEFYRDRGIPTAVFRVCANRAEVIEQDDFFPAVQKLARSGYDGRGVIVLADAEEARAKAFDAPSVLERRVNMEKEIGVLVVRDGRGRDVTYDPVEMVFDPEYNLVDYLIAPADLAPDLARQAREIAAGLARELDFAGLLAVEMFLTKTGELLVNESAPRAHNSGHHTMRACRSSQFEQQARLFLGLPPGDPALHRPALMLNLLGAPGHAGPAVYEGIEKVLAMSGVSLHLYGKRETRPFRKMGHAILLGDDRAELIERAGAVKAALRVVAATGET